MKNIFLSLCFLIVLASGCAPRGPIGSFVGPLPEKSAVAAIADDAAFILAGLYSPGHTTLRLLPAKNAENSFALAFENSLRGRASPWPQPIPMPWPWATLWMCLKKKQRGICICTFLTAR